MFDETDLAQSLPWKLATNSSSLEVYRTAEWVRRTVPLDILKVLVAVILFDETDLAHGHALEVDDEL